MDSSQSYQEVEASLALSVYHITRKSALERGFASECKNHVLRLQHHHAQRVISSGQLCDGCDAVWSPSDFIWPVSLGLP